MPIKPEFKQRGPTEPAPGFWEWFCPECKTWFGVNSTKSSAGRAVARHRRLEHEVAA